MQLGLDSYSYHLAFGCHADFRPSNPIDLFDFIDRVSDLGLAGFQIDPMHLGSTDYKYLENVRKKADDNGLFIEHGLMSVKPEDIEEGLKVCHILGSPILRTFIGFDRFAKTTNIRSEIERAKQQIRASLSELEKGGVKLAIENHGDVTSTELVEIITEINHTNVGICLDIGNCLCTLEEPLEALKRMVPFAVTTHFKDYAISMTNYGCKIYGVQLGQGILPLKEMLDIITQQTSLDRLVLEIPIEAEKDEKKTLQKEEQVISESVKYCRDVLHVV